MELTREKVNEILDSKSWRQSTSKRYEKTPHSYSLRKDWEDKKLFKEVCDFMRKNSVKEPFFRTFFMYYYHGNHKYWVMGVNEDWDIINRADKELRYG